jgi:hypothetical protein
MVACYIDSDLSDDARRGALYNGQILVFSPRPSTLALSAHARQMIEEAFAPHDPRLVHEVMPVEDCVAILARLKPAFIHHPRSKALLQALLQDLGCDPEKTYFDVPRMRSAMPQDYLTSGIAYAFHPHRDTWYSAPPMQLNWWMPVFDMVPENALALHPAYFSRPIKNGSSGYNYYRWNAESRANAAKHVKSDTRIQPHPEEPLTLDPDLRPIGPPGTLILFSAQQLHSTVPNTAGWVRWSVDFRTVNADDVARGRGAPNVDSACTGTALRDFLRATDLERLDESLVLPYDDGIPPREGIVHFPPAEPVVAA